jgi:uroporphyrinogen-III synthase
LTERLRALGADVIELPTIEVTDPADGGAELRRAAVDLEAGRYRWVVFTSPRAVERFLPLLRDARSFAGAAIAAIGPGTAAALAAHSLVADLVPPEFVAESLVAAFPTHAASPGNALSPGIAASPGNVASPGAGGAAEVLVPRAAVARDVLPEGLAAKGWTVDVVEAYRTEAARPDPVALRRAAEADAITFTSSSTVTNFVAAAPGIMPRFVACIGPVTAATARAAGFAVDVVASVHSIDGLVDALVSGLHAVPSS